MFGILLSLTSFLKIQEQLLSKVYKEIRAIAFTVITIIVAVWFMFLRYSFHDFEMKKSLSLETLVVNALRNAPQVDDTEVVSKGRNLYSSQDSVKSLEKRFRVSENTYEDYTITIKPKLCRSNSLSDLATKSSELDLNILKHASKLLENTYDIPRHSEDAVHRLSDIADSPFMSWKVKGKKPKKRNEMNPEAYASKCMPEFMHGPPRDRYSTYDPNVSSSGADNSSFCSVDQMSSQRGATFPFESTPSGNLKVQSNQVVFQSSTFGVLLADPTQAEVKVKFEGKAGGEPDDEIEKNFGPDDELDNSLQFKCRDNVNVMRNTVINERLIPMNKAKCAGMREDKGKELSSLGYAIAEPIDWMRVQLPKKQDLFQEFYRRLHNFINPDTLIHIGNEVFHCHHIVLQIYSNFFNVNHSREIELPCASVTPEAFHTIYEWMIYSGPESNKVLKRENVLDLFCAAQYLSIKDLEDQCWSFIVNDNLFTEDTAYALFREARAKGITPVMDLMVPRIMRFFLPLVASKDFLDLGAEEVFTLLKSNYICVTSEIEVLMAGVRWLYGEWPSRRHLAVQVMRCVRFGLISPWQLVDIKRNPDNSEILDIVNDPEVQQMVDDGLAYVIIKYWYGNNSQNYYHWIDVLGLSEPAERNWIGEEKNHVTYKDYLKYLEQFMVPKDQMYQQMAMMQPPRRNEDLAGSLRGMENDKLEMRRPKMDFPLPMSLKGLGGDKEKFPTMSEFFESKRKPQEGTSPQGPSQSRPPPHVPDMPMPLPFHMQRVLHEQTRNNMEQEQKTQHEDMQRKQMEKNQQSLMMRRQQLPSHSHVSSLRDSVTSIPNHRRVYEQPEKDSNEELNTTNSETSSVTVQSRQNSIIGKNHFGRDGGREKRHSVAACYLASATAALSSRVSEGPPSPTPRAPTTSYASRQETPRPLVPIYQNDMHSPQISLFNHSKESLARINMNKLSTSILGPSNKNYIVDGSLFNWDRETVLVFGGIDPHTAYGIEKNTGKNIYKFDPVSNIWECVGDLPEPRHHHSVAFLRGRVYLVGGADPRDDDMRGKSVVVSTVWSYEPVTRSWYSESGLSVPRKNFGLVVHRMALYAIGGQDKKGKVLQSVERFDPKTGSWSEVRSMGVARMAMAAAKYREYIWVAGGMTGERKRPVCKVVECYNSKTNEWTEIHTLRFPRCFSTLFAMNDKLYIVGGAGKVSDKEKSASSVAAIDTWEWREREWRHLTDTSIPRHGHALAYLGTQLIIIGGVTTVYMRALNNVESYCCERGAWIRGVAALPSPLSGHGAVTLPPASLM